MVCRGKAPILSKNFKVIIFIVEQERMLTENEQLKSLFLSLNMPGCRNVTMALMAYLSKEDIQQLCAAFHGKAGGHFLIDMARNMKFINGYINATDKSLYFTFFDEDYYKKIEIQQIAAISQKNTNMFEKYEKSFIKVTQWLKHKVPAIQDELSMLTEMIVNPDLPLPQMKR